MRLIQMSLLGSCSEFLCPTYLLSSMRQKLTFFPSHCFSACSDLISVFYQISNQSNFQPLSHRILKLAPLGPKPTEYINFQQGYVGSGPSIDGTIPTTPGPLVSTSILSHFQLLLQCYCASRWKGYLGRTDKAQQTHHHRNTHARYRDNSVTRTFVMQDLFPPQKFS